MEGLTEGRNVHYVAYNGRHLAAMVIGHQQVFDDSVALADLAVFTNMENANGIKSYGLQFHQSVMYSEEKKPGTWHWIEKA